MEISKKNITLIAIVTGLSISFTATKIKNQDISIRNMDLEITKLKEEYKQQEESCTFMLDVVRENAKISACYETIQALCTSHKDPVKCANLMSYMCQDMK